MRNPLKSATGRHMKFGGTVAPLAIKTIERSEAIELLLKVRRQGIYRPYIPHVVEALQKLKDGQHISFHIPQINGRDKDYNAKHLMSVINVGLMKYKIPHRLRYVKDDYVLVSEAVNWEE